MRFLEGLGNNLARWQPEKLAFPFEDVVGPRADHDVERLFPHPAGFGGVDAEAFEFFAADRPPGAEFKTAAAQEVERRTHLGDAHRMVVREWQQPNAVTDPNLAGALRDRAVEHLGRRTVRELGQKMMLDRPEMTEADSFSLDHLGDYLLERVVLGGRTHR